MKKIILQISVLLLISIACNKTDKQQKLKEEIQMLEKEFEAYVKTNGIAQGFYEFADDSAVILRENDSLIKGKNNIKTYYQKAVFKRASVSWTPDFINVADDKDESVIRIEPVMQTSTNTMTEFGPSPLYGIFPPTRGPANLLNMAEKL